MVTQEFFLVTEVVRGSCAAPANVEKRRPVALRPRLASVRQTKLATTPILVIILADLYRFNFAMSCPDAQNPPNSSE
jgi:hypothetical protein